MQQALILIDLINELIAPQGKLSGKGYADFAARHATLDRVAALLAQVRRQECAVIHVRIAFSPDYREQPKESPLFRHASKLGALRLGDWGTEFLAQAAPMAGEAILTKHRVNAFVGTPLDLLLRNNRVRRIAVVGCSTDVGVQTTVRGAHDLDYDCTVIGDCCIAPCDEDHEQTLRMLSKISRIATLEQFLAAQKGMA
jgi:nicotinamidase-related amidase